VARARSIKPGFFSNDALVELPFSTRLLFIGLWTIADKEGRLMDRPKKIKMEIFPGDDVDCDAALGELQSKGFLTRYEVDGVRYIQITNWKKHQNPHIKEVDSAIPVPAPEKPEQAPEIPERAGPLTSSLTPHSLTPDCGSPSPARAPTPAGEMAIALRDLGVSVKSTDKALLDWLRDGFTTQQAVDAVGIARIRKPHPEVIPPNYLDRILRQPARPPPASGLDRVTWRPPADEDDDRVPN
jgi:hypothetical protein